MAASKSAAPPGDAFSSVRRWSSRAACLQRVARAGLRGFKRDLAAAMQHAGVVECRNDGEQRIEPRLVFGRAVRTRTMQRRQAGFEHVRETFRSLTACAGHAEALGNTRTVTHRSG